MALISATLFKIFTFSIPFSPFSISTSKILIPDGIPCFISIILPDRLLVLFLYSPSISNMADCVFFVTKDLADNISIVTDFPAPVAPRTTICGFVSLLLNVSK